MDRSLNYYLGDNYLPAPIYASDVQMNSQAFPIAPREVLFVGRRIEPSTSSTGSILQREPAYWRFTGLGVPSLEMVSSEILGQTVYEG